MISRAFTAGTIVPNPHSNKEANRPMKKILLLEGIHPEAQKRLENEGFYVEMEAKALQGEALVSRVKGFHALGIRSKTEVNADVVKELQGLEALGAFCIGTNQVDVDMACEKAIPVFNAPYSNTRSVAEMVLSQMVTLSRKIAQKSMEMHQGIWKKSAVGSHEVRGKTLGIIGYGHIGSQLSVLAESLGLQVIFYDIVKKLPMGNARGVGSMEDLLSISDFVSLHVPETPLTKNLISDRELSLMLPGTYLINASRGSVVDIKSLAEKLESKHIAGAAIDVFPEEPSSSQAEFRTALQGLENVILTPHIGGSTEEAQESIGHEVSESLIRYLKFGATRGAVNFPEVDVTEPRKGHRITNIHKNVPGVLGDINKIISDLGGNILAQHLATNSSVGYLVTDLDIKNPDEALSRIEKLKATLRSHRLS